MGNEVSMTRKSKSKKKHGDASSSDEDMRESNYTEKDMNTSSSRQKGGNRKTPPPMEMSADTFDRQSQTPARRSDGIRAEYATVMITDGLTNVKERYHINPKEWVMWLL